MMEESFELQSSMSPKVKGHQKLYRKGGTTLLALKKNIRRSSIYDKSNHTINNAQLIIIDDSNSTDASSRSSNVQVVEINKSPIVISDTDCSENENDDENVAVRYPQKEKVSVFRSSREKSIDESNCLLSKGKLQDIERWIDRVNVETEIKTNITTYSELSTICGDTFNGNFKPEGVGCAINSTFVEPDCIRFDKLFKNGNILTDDKSTEGIKINGLDDPHSASDVIDDSFENQNDCVRNTHKKKLFTDILHKEDAKGVLNNSTDQSKYNKKSIVNNSEKLSKRSNSIYSTPNKEDMSTQDIGVTGSNIKLDENKHDLFSMLDDLYGNSWREKKEHVLPRSEPKKILHKPNLHVANTERKPKFSVLYKNPYMESEKMKSSTLLQNLQRSKIKNKVESPWSKLKNLCDSDTHSEDSSKINFRKKLDFNNETDSDNSEANDKLTNERRSKYFRKQLESACEVPLGHESNKENSDKELSYLDKECSYLGESLEERIRKKINKTHIPEERKNKVKVQTKQTVRTKEPLKEGGNHCANSITGNPSSTSGSNSSKTKKTPKMLNKKYSDSSSSVSSDDEWEKEVSKIVHESKLVNGKYSFLASLSANIPILKCDMSARIYRNNFKNYREQLLDKLFNLYNEKVFDNAIPKDSEFEWNDRLRGTAGYCSCKKITRRTGAIERKVKIVLSTKVIDAAYRLRDTLIHELCHAATWIVNCVSDGHGSYWKAWAYKAMKTFPELPPIKRCHDYVINTKYTYKCTGCGYSIGRHSKSLDIERKRCGYCRGKFEILLNKVSKKGETKSVPATPKREATGFALFVKENYVIYKNPQLKHGDVMKLLGQKFQELKAK